MTMAEDSAIDLMDLAPFIDGTENNLFARLRAAGPLHWNDEPAGPGFWSVTRYHDLIEVVSDPETFLNGEGTQILSRKVEGSTSTVHNTDPPRHGKLRKLATPHLRAVKIREWQDMIDAAADRILDSISGQPDIELVHSAAALLPIQVLGQVLGVPAEDCGLLLDWTNRVISDDPEFMRGPDEKEQARQEMFAYFAELTELRRREPQHDLISKLAVATIDGEPLSWEDLAAYYFVLVGAGNETTRNLITGSVLAFGQFPGEWDRLVAQPELLRPAIEEMLRFITPNRSPPPDPNIAVCSPQEPHTNVLMFSTTPATGIRISAAIRPTREATTCAAGCGVVTASSKACGTSSNRESVTSPVPGGRSMSKTSISPQWTSNRNCSSALCNMGPRHTTGAPSSTKKPTDINRTP